MPRGSTSCVSGYSESWSLSTIITGTQWKHESKRGRVQNEYKYLNQSIWKYLLNRLSSPEAPCAWHLHEIPLSTLIRKNEPTDALTLQLPIEKLWVIELLGSGDNGHRSKWTVRLLLAMHNATKYAPNVTMGPRASKCRGWGPRIRTVIFLREGY